MLAGQDRDRVWPQHRVQRVADLVVGPILDEVEMGDLTERMDAGIGAARAARDDLLAGERSDSFGEATLHRGAILLHLPADERRAVIFEGELVAGHGASLVEDAAGA